ncbi:hypothetical protein PG991_009128 [Apiospora marii]|uniref:BZIP domain-containing protein n=1 Tax=Apiospora marii TaxID=335849 RepID=A0ABR1RL43_9PEZI
MGDQLLPSTVPAAQSTDPETRRQTNRDAARATRARKAEDISQMRATIEGLRDEIRKMRAEISDLTLLIIKTPNLHFAGSESIDPALLASAGFPNTYDMGGLSDLCSPWPRTMNPVLFGDGAECSVRWPEDIISDRANSADSDTAASMKQSLDMPSLPPDNSVERRA